MKDILTDIVDAKKMEIKALKRERSYQDIEKRALNTTSFDASFSAALRNSSNGIISEFKRKSPSKGWINESYTPDIVPFGYQQSGAAAISILADSKFFGGKPEYIRIARESGVTIPILFKEFVIDEYQLFQAKEVGASAVLLIAACLDREACSRFISLAHDLNLETLLEIHSVTELDFADLDTDCIGVNNRNLGSFVTDIKNSFELAERLPKKIVKVSESGISNPATIRELRSVGYSGFLIGETFMKTDNPADALRIFISQL